MEPLSALHAHCEGNPSGTGRFPSQRAGVEHCYFISRIPKNCWTNIRVASKLIHRDVTLMFWTESGTKFSLGVVPPAKNAVQTKETWTMSRHIWDSSQIYSNHEVLTHPIHQLHPIISTQLAQHVVVRKGLLRSRRTSAYLNNIWEVWSSICSIYFRWYYEAGYDFSLEIGLIPNHGSHRVC